MASYDLTERLLEEDKDVTFGEIPSLRKRAAVYSRGSMDVNSQELTLTEEQAENIFEPDESYRQKVMEHFLGATYASEIRENMYSRELADYEVRVEPENHGSEMGSHAETSAQSEQSRAL